MQDKEFTIILDMDSTLLSIESLDTLIGSVLRDNLDSKTLKKARKEINSEMLRGMENGAPLSETIPNRIAIANSYGLKFSSSMLSDFAENCIQYIDKEMLSKIKKLSSKYQITKIAIVSSGVKEYVNVLQKFLIKEFNEKIEIVASGNTLCFTENGEYDLKMSNIEAGKIDAVKRITEAAGAIMIGDGSSDLAVFESGAAEYFIGYGVHTKRDVIFKKESNSPFFQKASNSADLSENLEKIFLNA